MTIAPRSARMRAISEPDVAAPMIATTWADSNDAPSLIGQYSPETSAHVLYHKANAPFQPPHTVSCRGSTCALDSRMFSCSSDDIVTEVGPFLVVCRDCLRAVRPRRMLRRSPASD